MLIYSAGALYCLPKTGGSRTLVLWSWMQLAINIYEKTTNLVPHHHFSCHHWESPSQHFHMYWLNRVWYSGHRTVPSCITPLAVTRVEKIYFSSQQHNWKIRTGMFTSGIVKFHMKNLFWGCYCIFLSIRQKNERKNCFPSWMKAIFHIFITRAFNCLGKCGVIIKKVSTLLWSQHGTPHRTDWTHEVFISLDVSITSKNATRFTGRPFLFNTLSLNAMCAWHVCLVKNYREQKYILDATTTASWSHFLVGNVQLGDMYTELNTIMKSM